MLDRMVGHYRVTERIGAGGMGEVFRARDMHLDRDVAIKMLPAGSLTDDDARAILDRARPGDRRGYQFRAFVALLLALEGKPDDARREMDAEVLKYLGLNPNVTLVAAEFCSVLGENERAFEWLERAIRNGDERVEWFTRDPMFTRLRGDPRFKQVLESITFRRQQTNR